MNGRVNGLADALSFVSEQDLLDFVQTQRWYGAKGRTATGLSILDQGVLRTEDPVLVDALVEIRYDAGSHDVYQLLIGPHEEGDAIAATDDDRRAVDALSVPLFARELVKLTRRATTIATDGGTMDFSHSDALGAADSELGDVRPLGVEQSNSSVVLGERLILKAYRRLEAGVNPELEMLRFLGQCGFENVPELRGWWTYTGPPMSATLGIVQRFLPDAKDGWTLALDELGPAPEAFLDRVERLGEVIGAMHVALASDPDDPAFSPEEAGAETISLLAATMDDEIAQVFFHLPDDDALAPIAGQGDAIRDLLRSLVTLGPGGRLIRQHGDLHLGQVLWSNGDWMVVDFEGEPARTLPERRRKRSPLRDVAGMLRSFDYAASIANVGDGEIPERARRAFLDGYLGAVSRAGILPPTTEATERLIGLFELEKVVYELRYELAHRPDWVGVPVAAISRMLERAGA